MELKRFIVPVFAVLISFGAIVHAAFPPSNTSQGGTGTTTPSGILYGDNGSTLQLHSVTIGSNLTFSGGTLSATGGSGTITSVATTYPVTGGTFTTSGTIGLAFGTTTPNTWANTQTFTTPLVDGTLSGLIAGNSGTTYAAATSSLGVTGPITFTGTLGSQVGGANGSFGCTTASAGVAGCLNNSDWSTFNSKQATIAATAPIRLIGTTLTFTGLATTSQPSSSNLLVSNGLAGVYGVATSSETCSTPLSCTAHAVLAGGGAITIQNSTITADGYLSSANFNIFNMKVATSASETAGNLAYWTTTSGSPAKVGTVATSSIGAGTGLTFSGTAGAQVGGAAGTYSLATITAGVLGAVKNVAVPTSQATSTLYGTAPGGMVLGWSNVTGGIAWIATSTGGTGTVTSVIAGTGLNGGTITASGQIDLKSYIATSTGETKGQLVYWTSTNGTPATQSSVATSSLTASGVLSLSQPISVIGASNSALTITGGSNGQMLTWGNGAPSWTSTSSPTSPITYTPSGGYACASCLTANQSITLTGAVTGSGATAITTAFGAMAQGVLTNTATASTIPTPQATSTLYGPAFTVLTSNYFTGHASTTPWGVLSINPLATNGTAPSFVVGSSTQTLLQIDNKGKLEVVDVPSGYTGVVSPLRCVPFTLATTTAWTGTTTGAYIAQVVIPFAGTIRNVKPHTDAGTLWLDLYHTSTHLALVQASTTIGTYSFTANNTVTAGEILFASAGTPASSPTTAIGTVCLTETP